jgi:DNA-binding NarL/FixJ family response regulator
MAEKILRRHMRRFPVTCAVHYFTFQGAGQGTVVNVSLEGLRMRGNFAVQADMLISMLLYLGDGKDPAKINGASVQWAQGNQFGVKFPSLPLPLKKRLMACFCVPPTQEHLLFEDSSAVPHEATVPKVTVPGGTILMVHDNANLLEVSAGILREERFTVVQAPGSSEALHLAQTYRSEIHLLLVDARLPPPSFQLAAKDNPFPRVHGVELTKCLLGRMKSLRAVVMSSDSEETLAKNGIHIGTLPFLRIPYSRDALVTTIRKVISEPALTLEKLDPPRNTMQHREIQWVG